MNMRSLLREQVLLSLWDAGERKLNQLTTAILPMSPGKVGMRWDQALFNINQPPEVITFMKCIIHMWLLLIYSVITFQAGGQEA